MLLVVLHTLFFLFLFAVARPWAQAPAFIDSGLVLETVATLPANQPVGLAWAPDGALFVWQKNGIIRIVREGALLSDPFLDLRPKVNTVNDRGLLGLALDPDFSVNGYVYLYYTYAKNGNPNDTDPVTSRITRVIASPQNRDVAVPGSETVILGKIDTAPCLEQPAGSDCLGADSHSHGAGTLRFGKDRKLLASVGDGASYYVVDTLALRSQDLNRYEGKILRINTDGSAPGDNPFDDGTQSIQSKVYSYGLRNPYRFAIHPVSGELFIGDVGWSKFEEINTGKGVNFGWPCFEGELPHSGYQNRFVQCRELGSHTVTKGALTYGHSQGTAVVGGTFNTADFYPVQYRGNFFYADFGTNTLWRMPFSVDGKPGSPIKFMTSANGPASIERGPDGHLYYIAFQSGVISRIKVLSDVPVAKAAADTLAGSSPLTVQFSSVGSKDPLNLPIRFLWDFGDGDTSSLANPVHIFSPRTTQAFSVTLTVTNSAGKKISDSLSITVGSSPPQASISLPTSGLAVRGGDTVRFSGAAVDAEETLQSDDLSWSVILHHNEHTHPYTSARGQGGYFVAMPHGEGEYKYEVILVAKDTTGLLDSQSVMITLIVPKNEPPTVVAGTSHKVAYDSSLTLAGNVSDDGLPWVSDGLKAWWSCKSAPTGGEAVFMDSTSLTTQAKFTKPGDYLINLYAFDGELESASQFKVTVTPPLPVGLASKRGTQFKFGAISLKETEKYHLTMVDMQGRPEFQAQGRGGLLGAHVAEALAKRAAGRMYLLRVSVESSPTASVMLLSPTL